MGVEKRCVGSFSVEPTFEGETLGVSVCVKQRKFNLVLTF